MSLPARITLAPSVRPIGGLLAAARPIGGEWWRGVTFSSPVCAVPQTFGGCDNSDTSGGFAKEYQRPSTVQTFESFGVLQAIECSTMGRTNVSELAEQSLDVTREFAVARELLTGIASGNPSLASAVTVGVATDPVAALGCLDQAAAENLSGRLAYIHASPAIGNAWLAANAIWRDGRLWRTSLGSVVVVAAGYDGRAPGGDAPAPGASLYAYATSEVYAEVGQRETRNTVDRAVNTAQAWSEEAAIVVFDPCYVAAIDTQVELCAEVS